MSAHPVMLGVHVRRALARSAVRRAAVLSLAVATGLVVVSLVSSADAARQRWGRARPVVVATRDLAPGDIVDASAVEVRRLPEAAVTPAALAEPPSGSVVRQPVAAGEPLVAERLAPEGLTGVAALVPAGHRAVAIPIGPLAAPPLTIGDLVDVLAVVPLPTDGRPPRSAEPPSFPLVEAAPVVDVGDQSIAVAVPEADAPRVAWVLANGSVVLALGGV
ncbi:MAG TPA: SAF domain-containing protein [Acidimicrobiales bacterium]|nr:SAF domain-containing protein [Acidimicrobiales bacterium]